MKYQLENSRNGNRSATKLPFGAKTGRTEESRLFAWLDRQLAELEEKHAGFVTRNSLARHYSATC